MVLMASMVGMGLMVGMVLTGGATGAVRVLNNPVYIKAALQCQDG